MPSEAVRSNGSLVQIPSTPDAPFERASDLWLLPKAVYFGKFDSVHVRDATGEHFSGSRSTPKLFAEWKCSFNLPGSPRPSPD